MRTCFVYGSSGIVSREPRIGSAGPSWKVAGVNGLSGSDLRRAAPHALDRQPAGVELERDLRLDAGLPLDVQDRHPLQHLAVEVHGQVQVQVSHPHLVRIAERMRISAFGRIARRGRSLPVRPQRGVAQRQDEAQDGDQPDHHLRRNGHRDQPPDSPAITLLVKGRLSLPASRLATGRSTEAPRSGPRETPRSTPPPGPPHPGPLPGGSDFWGKVDLTTHGRINPAPRTPLRHQSNQLWRRRFRNIIIIIYIN